MPEYLKTYVPGLPDAPIEDDRSDLDTVADAMVERGMATSRSEARRRLQGGGYGTACRVASAFAQENAVLKQQIAYLKGTPCPN
jgi:hypothetical protein